MKKEYETPTFDFIMISLSTAILAPSDPENSMGEQGEIEQPGEGDF